MPCFLLDENRSICVRWSYSSTISCFFQFQMKTHLADVLPLISFILNHSCFILQDVFTVSVGNLPPGCVALIKITYVSELQVEGELINFSIPGSVAPWKQEVNNTEVR